MRERIRQAMSTVFGLATGDIPDDVTPDQIDEWDSLRQLELMLELEMEFSIRIDAESVAELVSIDAIEEYLNANGAG